MDEQTTTAETQPHPKKNQFYNVYAGMSYDEWSKIRNAFMAEYFKNLFF